MVEDTKAQDLAAAEMELKMMQENRRKKDKGKYREIEKRRDKDKVDSRGKHREHRDSINEFAMMTRVASMTRVADKTKPADMARVT